MAISYQLSAMRYPLLPLTQAAADNRQRKALAFASPEAALAFASPKAALAFAFDSS
jgi:hypothetical protein